MICFPALLLLLCCYVANGHCTFENGMCDWMQDTTDDFNWRSKTGGTTTALTGPKFDHTVGSIKGDHIGNIFLYHIVINSYF